jgi:hypothetical protein
MYEPGPCRQWQPSPYLQSGGRTRWIIVLCILWTIFAPVPGPFDDLVVWAFGVYIKPGNSWENGYCESINGKLRGELLDREIFYSLREAQVLIERW